MEVVLGVSNRHVHLNEEDYKILFNNQDLEVDRYLVQPHQFASKQFVTIKTQKSYFEHVRVLGPIRNYTQVEISKTDAYKLGINPPIRDSGDLRDASEITIIGPTGSVTKNVCIIANRHIHITEKMKKYYGFNNVNEVEVEFIGEKSTIFKNVKLKVLKEANFELHLDTDDANGSLLKTNDIGIIKKP